MRKLRNLFTSLFAFLALTGTASAQFTITNVFNAANRVVNAAIAQGALIAIQGKGVGTPDIEQATFPLPTTAGLGGVTVQIIAGGQSYDGIIVYTKPAEIGAILPSAVPIGPATVTVNNNGVTASKNIIVVASSFGIFTQNYGITSGFALAFNVNADGSTTLNTATQSVMPGQDIVVNGTGLGAIPSDETQSGVTDVPAANVKVFIGIQPATLVSAGRGTCCDGIDPAYQVPQGIAAWDVIRFTVPDGVVGCYLPVIVQIDKFVSNLATISIDPGGAGCTLPTSLLPPDLQQKLSTQTGFAGGTVDLGRSIGFSVNANTGALSTTRRDTGSAGFVKYANVPASMFSAQTIFPENVCSINGFPGVNGPNTIDQNGTPVTIVPLVATALDAGTPIVVSGPSGSKNIVKRTAGNVFDYPGVTFGDTTPGNYFDSGHYTVTAAGGKDVGAFKGAIDVPAPHFVWANMPDVRTPIDRTQDLVIKWTGGAPNTQVTAVGGGLANGVNTAFLCAADVSAGQLTIPSYVLLQIPATSTSPVSGQLTVGNRSVTLFTASGLDLGSVGYADTYTVFVKYQ